MRSRVFGDRWDTCRSRLVHQVTLGQAAEGQGGRHSLQVGGGSASLSHQRKPAAHPACCLAHIIAAADLSDQPTAAVESLEEEGGVLLLLAVEHQPTPSPHRVHQRRQRQREVGSVREGRKVRVGE